MFRFAVRCLVPVLLLAIFVLCPVAPAQVTDSGHQLARDIFKQLVEINTTDSVGNVTTAAKAMEQRLLDAGFPKSDIFIGGASDTKQNLVVR